MKAIKKLKASSSMTSQNVYGCTSQATACTIVKPRVQETHNPDEIYSDKQQTDATMNSRVKNYKNEKNHV